MRNLTYFKTFRKDEFYIVYHGLGAKGGGEIVAQKLKNILGIPKNLFLSHKIREIDLLKIILNLSKARKGLFISGPRDILSIIINFFSRKKTEVYLLVPYYKTLSINDPVHIIIIILYYIIINLFAENIYVTSNNTAKWIFRGYKVILPIENSEIRNPSLMKNSILKRVNLSCRLEKERGRGSRDLNSIYKLCEEIGLYNLENERSIKIVHYGECDIDIKRCLEVKSRNAIEFKGFDPKWKESLDGSLIFLSNFEGFGLSAFEASQEGFPVYVNEAFPEELLCVCKNIQRIYSRSNHVGILEQIL